MIDFDEVDFDELRQVPILEVLDLLEMDRPSSSGKIRSFFHEDSDPSLHIYENTNSWFDFSTGKGGSVIDLVQQYLGVSFGKAVRILAGADLAPTGTRPDTARQVLDLTDRFEAESEDVRLHADHVSELVAKRWGYLTIDDLDPFLVRATRYSIWVPHFLNEHTIVGIKVRDFAGSKLSVKGSTFTRRLYRPFHQLQPLYQRKKVALLVEGEPDCWSAHKAYGVGMDVFALPSGAGSWKPAFADELAGYEHVAVCFDNDEAGRKAREDVRATLGARQVDWPVPAPFNDLTEWLGAK